MAKAQKAPAPNGNSGIIKTIGIVTVIVGIFYLLTDLGTVTFSVNPWTVVFILGGLLLVLK
tara:strand:- start:513 stop:695 length:183 start_codon:yes stop_codon:yes gene_type:complete